MKSSLKAGTVAKVIFISQQVFASSEFIFIQN